MGFININVLMDKVTRHPLMRDITLESVMDYAIEFIRIVGIPQIFIEKVSKIEIDDFKGKLPCDFYEVRQVRTTNGKYFRSSTNTFHMGNDKSVDLTYKIQGSCIFTSIPKGDIEMSYLAMPIDENGSLLLNDNSAYIRALELYIKLQWFTIKFDEGKITPQVLSNTQQQYSWAVGQASTNLIIPTLDQMETLSNIRNKFLPDITDDHNNGYINQGTKERIIIH